MLREHAPIIGHSRKIVDLLLTAFSFFAALYIRNLINHTNNSFYSVDTMLLFGFTVAIWIGGFSVQKIYESQRFDSIRHQLAVVIKAVVINDIILFAVITMSKIAIPGRLFLLAFTVINVVLLAMARVLVARFLLYIRKHNINTRHIIIVGTDKEASEIIKTIHNNPSWGINIKGLITTKSASATFDNPHIKISLMGYPILGSLKNFEQIISSGIIDMVFFATTPWQIEQVKPYIVNCLDRGIETKISGSFFSELSYVNTKFEKIADTSMITFSTLNHNPTGLVIKNLFERMSALVALVMLSPVFILVSLAIKLTSSGAVFYKQKRVGVNGRQFNMYKFRSMYADAEKRKESLKHLNEMSGPVFKMTNDPRITGIGKFIRKTSIDELPQLFNVLIGDMSLVGPRPPLPEEVKQYDAWQKRRLSVKPGITCSWQVSGRNHIDFDTWMKMDLEYIDNWSLGGDFKLLLKTMPAVLFQKGAK